MPRKIESLYQKYNTPTSLAWPKARIGRADAQWIAAVLDCEGTLHVGSYLNKQRGGYNFRTSAQVSMTDPQVIERIHSLCGGSLHKYAPRNPKRRGFLVWNLSSNGLRWLLPQIRKHLLIKPRQAELILEFLSLSKRGVSSRSAYNPRAQEIRKEMAELNFRGVRNGSGKTSERISE